MPIFEYNGKKYNVRDEHIDSFVTDFPDASTIMEREGKKYRVKSADYKTFMSEQQQFEQPAPDSTPENSVTPVAGEKPLTKQDKIRFGTGMGQVTTPLRPGTFGRHTLRELAKNTVQIPLRRDTDEPESQDMLWSKEMSRMETARTEAAEDEMLMKKNGITSAPAESDEAIYTKYRDMFNQTERGRELDTERAEIERGVFEKYLDEYKGSDEYRALVGKKYGSREEAENELRNEFAQLYGDRIQEEMRPYNEAYQEQLRERYGDRMNKETAQLRKKELIPRLDGQIKAIDNEISRIEDKRRQKSFRERYGHGTSTTTFGAAAMENRDKTITERRREEALLREAKDWLGETKDLVDAAVNKSGFWRGLGNKMGDPDTWSFGFGDIVRSGMLQGVLNKSERGEKLSDAEEKYLEAAVTNMAANAYYRSDLSRLYKAGETTGESLPFMLEFAINPISGSGSAVAKSLLKYGIKKFGKAAMKKGVSKFAARAVGDMVAAGGMTLTTGLPGVAADAIDRLNQNYTYTTDANGELKVVKTGDTSIGEAVGKSLASRFLENQSEMVFNAFKGAGKQFFGAIRRHLPGGVNRFMNSVKNSDIGRLYRDITGNPTLREAMRRTQFHGISEEYLEEVYNNFANIPLGDMTFEEATDLNNNIDTFLGLAPTSILFGAVGLGGMVRHRRNVRRNIETLRETMDATQRDVFDEWMAGNEYKTDDKLRAFVQSIVTNEYLTPEQKKPIIAAVFLKAQEKAAQDITREQTETERFADEAYEEGMNAPVEALHNIGMTADAAMQELFDADESVGNLVQEMAGSDATMADLDEELKRRGLSMDVKRLARNAFVANARIAGVTDAAAEAAEADINTFSDILQGVAVETEDRTRTVTTAMLNEGEKQSEVFVYNSGTDAGMAIIIGKDGKKTAVDPKRLSDVQSRPYDDLIGEYAEARRQQAREQTEWSLNHNAKTKVPETGMVFTSADNTFLMITGQVGNSWQVFPARLDPKTGTYVPVTDTQGTTMSTDEVLKAQDDYYNAVEANEKGQPQTESPQEAGEIQPQTVEGLNDEEAKFIVADMEGKAEPAPEMELTVENWEAEFGEDGVVNTPIGNVKMGENQYLKLLKNKRNTYFGMIRPTLANPDMVLEEYDPKEGAERATKYLFVKTFVKPDGSRYVHFESVTVQKDNLEVSISSHEINREALLKKVHQDKLIHLNNKFSGSGVRLTGPQKEGSDLIPAPNSDNSSREVLSKSESSAFREEKQEKGEGNLSNGKAVQKSAFKHVPRDEQGNPVYERAETPDLAWDAIVEQADGDEAMAQTVVDGMVADKEAALKKLEKAKSKGGVTVAEKIAAEKERKAAIDAASQELSVWKKIAGTANRRKRAAEAERSRVAAEAAAVRKAEEERQRAEREEAERIKREALNGVPDIVDDIPQDARARGYRRVNGHKVDRQEPVQGDASDSGETKTERNIQEPLRGSDEVYAGERTGSAEQQAGNGSDRLRNNDRRGTEIRTDARQGDLAQADEVIRYNSQGNPIDKKGNLIIEQVNSLSEITDNDFTNPTRTVALPALPSNVSSAIDTGGRKVIIKKNIFERNSLRHEDLSPADSREILNAALYNPNFFGQNQKTKKPHNWILINLTEGEGKNRFVLLEVNVNKENVEIVHWHYGDNRAVEKAKRQAEREDGQLLILPSVISEEAGALSSPTFGLPSVSKSNISSPEKQANGAENSENVGIGEKISEAEAEVNTNPTDKQKEAGNYKKGHVQVGAFDITIENPKGSVRSGVDVHGKKWETTMQNTYGYMRGTEGVDGDHIDVFLSGDMDGWNGRRVFVVDQYNEDGSFDEHKVMLGFNDADEAEAAYLSNYSKDWADKRKIVVTSINLEDFEKWIDSSHRKTKPFAEYNIAKAASDQEQADVKATEETPPHLLPKRLRDAYESGDAAAIADVERVLRDYVGQADRKQVAATYFFSKDKTREIRDTESPVFRMFKFIAETCKDTLVKAGIPKRALQSLKTRRDFAATVTDPAVLDVMSADPDIEVLRTVIRNPNTSEATLRYFMEVYNGYTNGLDYDAKRALEQRETQSNADNNILFREVNNADNKSLVAVHNLSAERLSQALELGGFPMPSIAITKADVGHTNFGDISLVFDKESINPTDRRNKVYGEDAWTPMFPQVGYKLNDEKTSDIYRRANKAGNLPLFNPANFHPDNFERHVEGLGSESLVEHFKDDYGAKQLYLSETGNAVKEFEQHEVEKYSAESIGLYEKVLKAIGLERLKNDSYEALENEMKQLVGQHKGIDFDGIKPFRVKVLVDNTIRHAIDYAENGNKKIESDIKATMKKIDERVNPKEFEAWLKDLFDGVVEKKGIRNDRDPFTPSGNRRKWEDLYDKITLDNVVGAMRKQAERGGQGLFGGSIFGAAQEEYKSIDEIRESAQERIRIVDEADYQAQRNVITDRLSAIKIPGTGESFSDTMDMVQNIQDAVARSHTPKGIHKYLKEFYPKVTMKTANEIADIVKDIQRMSARYFEAKPYRAVGFDEVRLAVVPSDTDADLVTELERRGIPVRTYEKGNEAQRKKIVEEATDELNLRFRVDENALTDEKMQEVNRKFNEELSGLNEKNANSVRLKLGHPSNVLLSAGIPDKPLILYGNKLLKKAQKHNFDIKDVRNLPVSLEHPIAVFDGSHSNSYAVLTEMQINGKNVLVSIETNKQGEVDFNIISSVFGKNDKGVIKWVIDGKLKYVDKEKALPYISTSAPIADATYKEELSSATKIVENFENPIIDGEEFSSFGDDIRFSVSKATEAVARTHEENVTAAVSDLSGKLNTPVRVIRGVDELPADSEVRDRIEQGRGVKGWFDPSTGEVVVYLPNALDEADAVRTVLHETVGHKGLRELFGIDEFDRTMMELYKNLPREARAEIARVAVDRYLGNVSVAMDEYLAEQAEKDETPSWWEKVVSAIRDLLRRTGIDVELSGNDVKYLLWRSRRNLERGSIMQYAEDRVMRSRLGVEQNREPRYRTVEVRKGNAQNDASVRDEYEKALKKTAYAWTEAFQDSMRSLKEFQDIVAKASGREVKDYENAYMAENALSSKNLAQTEDYKRRYIDPIVKALAGFVKAGVKAEDVSGYLMVKHGVERNREMAVRTAIAKVAGKEENKAKQNEMYKKLLDVWTETKKEVQGRDLTWAEQERILNTIAVDNYGADLSHDYSGLSARFNGDFTKEAILATVNFEEKHSVLCRQIGDVVRKATDRILDIQMNGGLMSAETCQGIKDMYRYYVPLRGWEDGSAEDVYSYIGTEHSAFNAPLKKAKGRKSKADDPLATIASMGESGIAQANRNLMKQRFLTLVQNHPNDLVSVRDLYVKYNPDTKDYTVVQPQIPENATPEEVNDIMDDFTANMEKLATDKNSGIVKASELGDIPYRVPSARELKQHIILVKRNGKQYMLTVNGNPRLAQAVNGLTNPDTSANSEDVNWLIRGIQSTGRFMASNFTTRNPEFAISNFIRDMIFSNNMVWLKEEPAYAFAFNKNYLLCNPARMNILINKYEKGMLNKYDELERYFSEFMLNGGETGYTNIKQVQYYKKRLEKDAKVMDRMTARKAVNLLGSKIDILNRSVENCSRFAAYVTSRQAGRSVTRSVWDAKEITVNFNKKGAGGRMIDRKNQRWYKNLPGYLSGLGRILYIFWNAGVQGLANVGKSAIAHPGKFAAMCGTYYCLGLLSSALGDDDGEEDSSYYDLPEWVRRSNICFQVGGKWITLPLPIEFRAMYGLGEITASVLNGRETANGLDLVKKVAGQVTQILPVDPIGEGGLVSLVPSGIKPGIEVLVNKDWTGLPVYKDNDFNENMPEWTKAYKSTASPYVEISKFINSETGGDKYSKGWGDGILNNPGVIEHMVNGYLGGLTTFAGALGNTIEMAWNKDKRELRNIPVARRILREADVRQRERRIKEEYFDNLKKIKRIRLRENGYKEELKNPETSDMDFALYQKKLNDLLSSDEYFRYRQMKQIKDYVDKIRRNVLNAADTDFAQEMMLENMKMLNEIARSVNEPETVR